MLEQRLAAFWTNSGHVFKDAFHHAFGTQFAVVRDRVMVHFVAHGDQHSQCRVRFGQPDFAILGDHGSGLEPPLRPVNAGQNDGFFAFGQTDHWNFQSNLFERLEDRRNLSESTVDHQQVGNRQLVGQAAGEASHQGLFHRGVIVRAIQTFDLEAAVFTFAGASTFEHDHARNDVAAEQIRVVEPLDSPWAFRQRERLFERIQAGIRLGTCTFGHGARGRYRYSVEFPFSNGATATIQLCATTVKQKGSIRIELNPSSLNKKHVRELHTFMRGIIGEKYDELLLNPIINRVDFAVDVENLSLDDILVDYQYAQRVTVFGKRMFRGGKIETLNFGSLSSDYVSTAYDKSTELTEKLLKRLISKGVAAEKLGANSIKQLKRSRDAAPVVRVEVRCKKQGLPLWKLVAQRNRFEAFRFSELSRLGELSAFDRQVFISMCRDLGVKAALAGFEGRKVHAKLKKVTCVQPAWWQPQDMWNLACASLRAKGIFPHAAFEEPEA